ncbi:hypothetical protein HKBW3S09_01936, partial [Candidatus Hakubella thermalkaliphila]
RTDLEGDIMLKTDGYRVEVFSGR